MRSQVRKHNCMNLLKILIIQLVLMAFCAGCASGDTITINTLEPAPVSIHKRIKSIGIINESTNVREATNHKGIAGLVDKQDLSLSQAGRQAALSSLLHTLRNDARFDTVYLIQSEVVVNLPPDSLPGTISWEQLKKICRAHEVDALFSLVFYDTDTQIKSAKTTMLQADLMRVKNEVPAREITLNTVMAQGWYIYDPFRKEIIDAMVYEDRLTISGQGINMQLAMEAIENRKDSIINRSSQSGGDFAGRLQPTAKKVERPYFQRGSDQLQKGGELIKVGNWEAATVLWEEGLLMSDKANKGKYCHNLAVYHEYIGDLTTALEWAAAAYGHFGNKKSFEYMALIEQRKEQFEVVKEQLSLGAIEF